MLHRLAFRTALLAWLAPAAIAAQTPSSANGVSVAPRPDIVAMDRTARALADSGFSGVILVALGDTVVLRRAYGAGATPAVAPGGRGRGAAGARDARMSDARTSDARPSDASGRTPVRITATSTFWLASITKSFTAAGTLELARAGRLALTDTLAKFFPLVPADKRRITVRQLLTHTAGFSTATSGAGQTTRDGAVRAILADSLAYAPGTGYEYGNADYELLAAIIEIVTRQPWQRFTRDSLLEPRGLQRLGFFCESAAGDGGRSIETRNAVSRVPVAGIDGSSTPCGRTGRADWGHIGANGMSGTADDLWRWVSVLASDAGRDAFPGLTSPQVHVRTEGAYDVSYGYGVRVYSRDGRITEVMHAGSGDDGHTAVARQLTSGVTIVVLSNAGQRDGASWSGYVAERLAPREN